MFNKQKKATAPEPVTAEQPTTTLDAAVVAELSQRLIVVIQSLEQRAANQRHDAAADGLWAGGVWAVLKVVTLLRDAGTTKRQSDALDALTLRCSPLVVRMGAIVEGASLIGVLERLQGRLPAAARGWLLAQTRETDTFSEIVTKRYAEAEALALEKAADRLDEERGRTSPERSKELRRRALELRQEVASAT